MFNNSFNGYNSNNFNSMQKNFNNGNIAGLNKVPSNISGVANKPKNLVGSKDVPTMEDKFKTVHTEKPSLAKQVMNSQGQNIIHNEFRGIKN